MSAIQIKCYLLPEDCKIVKKSAEKATEIRRFNIERNGNGLYDNLLEKILAYFKNIFENKDNIKTYYLDDENEFIGFSSDSEFQYGIDLQLALKMSNTNYNAAQNIFKVFIIKRKTVEQSGSTSANNDEIPSYEHQQQQHLGVVCDGCNGPIIGMRHKCAICPNYDLCSICEGKGIHKDTEHRFIKIEFPQYFRPKCGRFHHKRHHKHLNNLFGNMYSNVMTSVNTPEQLKKFGEYLKGVLEPFGIDIDYDVNNSEKRNDKKTEDKQNETKMDTQSTDCLKAETTDGIEKATFDSSLITINTDKKAEATNVITPSSASATTTTIPKLFPNLNETTSSSEKPHDDIDGFNMVDMEKEVKILKSVEQLKEMGFDDQNNWLTLLVKSKEGNINAVLDALSPLKFKF